MLLQNVKEIKIIIIKNYINNNADNIQYNKSDTKVANILSILMPQVASHS